MAKGVNSPARPVGRPVGRDGHDSVRALLDAAEKRMRRGGFDAFSFRDIGEDVGVKSSSVHFHFPTKENLAAAVIRRYTDDTARRIERRMAIDKDPVKAWTRAFQVTAHSEDRICPCTVLAAAAQELPPEVAAEVKHFYEMCINKMTAAGLTRTDASALIAMITGALVVANALGDNSEYDRATDELVREPGQSGA